MSIQMAVNSSRVRIVWFAAFVFCLLAVVSCGSGEPEPADSASMAWFPVPLRVHGEWVTGTMMLGCGYVDYEVAGTEDEFTQFFDQLTAAIASSDTASAEAIASPEAGDVDNLLNAFSRIWGEGLENATLLSRVTYGSRSTLFWTPEETSERVGFFTVESDAPGEVLWLGNVNDSLTRGAGMVFNYAMNKGISPQRDTPNRRYAHTLTAQGVEPPLRLIFDGEVVDLDMTGERSEDDVIRAVQEAYDAFARGETGPLRAMMRGESAREFEEDLEDWADENRDDFLSGITALRSRILFDLDYGPLRILFTSTGNGALVLGRPYYILIDDTGSRPRVVNWGANGGPTAKLLNEDELFRQPFFDRLGLEL